MRLSRYQSDSILHLLTLVTDVHLFSPIPSSNPCSPVTNVLPIQSGQDHLQSSFCTYLQPEKTQKKAKKRVLFTLHRQHPHDQQTPPSIPRQNLQACDQLHSFITFFFFFFISAAYKRNEQIFSTAAKLTNAGSNSGPNLCSCPSIKIHWRNEFSSLPRRQKDPKGLALPMKNNIGDAA